MKTPGLHRDSRSVGIWLELLVVALIVLVVFAWFGLMILIGGMSV